MAEKNDDCVTRISEIGCWIVILFILGASYSHEIADALTTIIRAWRGG